MTSYDDLVTALSPFAWWKLTEHSGSSTASDSSGNGFTATVRGGVTFGAPGPPSVSLADTAAAFNGTDGCLTTACDHSVSAYSVVAWVNLTTESEYPMIISQGETASGGGLELRFQDTTGHATFISVTDNGGAFDTVDLAATGWHMLVGTSDGITMMLYKDGNLVASADDPTSSFNMNPPVRVGNRADDSGFCFPGTLAQIALFPVVLSGSQIAALFAATNNLTEGQPGVCSVAQELAGAVSVS